VGLSAREPIVRGAAARSKLRFMSIRHRRHLRGEHKKTKKEN
jgi:hypothetical protein